MTQLQDSDSLAAAENGSPLVKRAEQSSGGYGKLAVGVAVGIVLTLTGSRLFAGDSSQPQEPVMEAPSQVSAQTVTIAPAQSGQVIERLTVKGSVQPADLLQITPQIGGLQIQSVLVNEGDRVAAGQPLVVLDDTELRTQIQQARSQIDVAEAQIQQQEANLAQSRALLAEAEANEVSYRSLADQGAVSQEELRNRTTETATAVESVRVSEAAVASAEASVRSSQSEVERLENRLDDTTIYAPLAGIVAERPASVGDVSSTSSPVVTLIEGNQLELAGEVPQAQLPQVQVGAPAIITSSTDPNIRAEGTVQEIEPLVDPQTRLAKMMIRLPESDRIRSGMFLTADIQVGQRSGLLIPSTALLPQADGSMRVYVLGPDQTAISRTVETGARVEGTGDDVARVEILRGLTPGEQVIVAGASYVQEGDTVTVGE